MADLAGSSWKQKVFAFFLTAEWTWKSAGGQSGKPRLETFTKGIHDNTSRANFKSGRSAINKVI